MDIEIKKMSFSYDNHEVFNDFNFLFEETGIFSIFGPNGRGKTTLLSLLNNDLLPVEGTISGVSKNRMIILNSNIPFSFLTGMDFIVMSLKINSKGINNNEIYRRAREIGLDIDTLNRNYISSYSRGMRFKLLMIIVLVSSPELLLLDEPFTELDSITNQNLVTILEKSGIKQIIFSTHTAEVAYKYSDKILYLQKDGIDKKNTSDFNSVSDLNKYIYTKMEDESYERN